MKKLYKRIIIGGTLACLMTGVLSSYITALIVRENTGVGDVVRNKAKEAFKGLVK